MAVGYDWYENNKKRCLDLDSRKITLGEIWEQESRQQKEEERVLLENTKADARAVWVLADYKIPPDIRDAAKRWKMDESLLEIWRQAFIEGWRAAYRKHNV